MTITLNTWTAKNGTTRTYVNGWHEAAGIEIDYYKTGNISSAYVKDERVSNSKAGSLLGIKVWIDEVGAYHVDHNNGQLISNDDIISAIRAELSKEA